jgi:hypothetical protein
MPISPEKKCSSLLFAFVNATEDILRISFPVSKEIDLASAVRKLVTEKHKRKKMKLTVKYQRTN